MEINWCTHRVMINCLHAPTQLCRYVDNNYNNTQSQFIVSTHIITPEIALMDWLVLQIEIDIRPDQSNLFASAILSIWWRRVSKIEFIYSRTPHHHSKSGLAACM